MQQRLIEEGKHVTLRTEKINEKHNRSKFDCGTPPLNEFLKKTARQSGEKMATRTYALVEDVEKRRQPFRRRSLTTTGRSPEQRAQSVASLS